MELGISTVVDGSFEDVMERVLGAMKEVGFSSVSEINISKTLKEKIGVDRKPMTIIGACNAVLANKAIEAEPDIPLFLPCNVVVEEVSENKIKVAIINPEAMMSMFHGDEIKTIAAEVKQKAVALISKLGVVS